LAGESLPPLADGHRFFVERQFLSARGVCAAGRPLFLFVMACAGCDLTRTGFAGRVRTPRVGIVALARTVCRAGATPPQDGSWRVFKRMQPCILAGLALSEKARFWYNV